MKHENWLDFIHLYADYLEEKGSYLAQCLRIPHIDTPFDVLKYKVIESVKMSSDGLLIINDYAFSTEGDCSSWARWYKLKGVKDLIGAKVLGIYEGYSADLPDLSYTEDYEEVTYYAYLILTNKGFFEPIFIHSSNGYYGGWVALAESTERKNLTDIIEDWQYVGTEQN